MVWCYSFGCGVGPICEICVGNPVLCAGWRGLRCRLCTTRLCTNGTHSLFFSVRTTAYHVSALLLTFVVQFTLPGLIAPYTFTYEYANDLKPYCRACMVLERVDTCHTVYSWHGHARCSWPCMAVQTGHACASILHTIKSPCHRGSASFGNGPLRVVGGP